MTCRPSLQLVAIFKSRFSNNSATFLLLKDIILLPIRSVLSLEKATRPFPTLLSVLGKRRDQYLLNLLLPSMVIDAKALTRRTLLAALPSASSHSTLPVEALLTLLRLPS